MPIAKPVEPAPAPLVSTAAALDCSGFALFDQVRGQAPAAENTFISPVSVQQAMGLVRAGARGATAQQIDAWLGLPPGTDPDAALAAQRQAVTGSFGNSQVKLANALWLGNRFAFQPGYLDLTRNRYAATAQRLDFAAAPQRSADTINAWAAKNTNGLITNVVDASGFDAATAAVLTNAVYFDGEWEARLAPAVPEPFLFGSGREAPFAMMHKRASYAYAEADGWKAVRLPYASQNRFAMDLFVPLRRQTGAVLSAATYRKLTSALDTAPAVLADIALPRFEVVWKQTLNDVLMALGITEAFSRSADLSGIAGGPGELLVSKVAHASRLQVFETGTLAAAVTTVEIVTTSAPIGGPLKQFRADQPFYLAIRELGSGAPLFLGRIADPQSYAGS